MMMNLSAQNCSSLSDRGDRPYSTPFSQPGGPEFVRRDRRIDLTTSQGPSTFPRENLDLGIGPSTYPRENVNLSLDIGPSTYPRENVSQAFLL